METHGSIVISQMIAGMVIITLIYHLMLENNRKLVSRDTLRLFGTILNRKRDTPEEHGGGAVDDDATNLRMEVTVLDGDTVVCNNVTEMCNVFGSPNPGPCEDGHASTLLSVSMDDVKSTDAGKDHCGSITATGGSILPSKRGLDSAGDRGRRRGKQEENKPPVSRANGFSPVSDDSDNDATRSKRRVGSSSASGGEGFSPLSDDELTSAGGDVEVATGEPDGARIAAPHGKVPSRLGSSAIHSPPGAASLVATITATCATTADATGADANSDHLILGAAAVSICIVLVALAMISSSTTKWGYAPSSADGERGEVSTDMIVVNNPMPKRNSAPPALRVKRGEIPVDGDENDFGSDAISEYIEGKMFFMCSPPSRIQLANAVVQNRCIALHGLPFTRIVGTTFIDEHGVQRSYRPEDLRDDIMGQWALITRVQPSPYPSAPALMTRAQLGAYDLKQADDDTDLIGCPAMWDPLWNVLLPTAPFTWAI
jgi:hypothetical protein